MGRLLDEYTTKMANGGEGDMQQKEAVMFCIAQLADLIKEDANMLSCIEQLLEMHALNELENGIGLLRYTAMFL